MRALGASHFHRRERARSEMPVGEGDGCPTHTDHDFFVGLLSAIVAADAGEDLDWTAVTVARDGSWGVATTGSQSQAIAAGIRNCRAMSLAGSDCGAELTTIRGGWTLALRCSDYRNPRRRQELEAAETAALNREIDLQLFYVPDLPPCRRILTVDPEGTANTPTSLSTKAANFVPAVAIVRGRAASALAGLP